MLLGKYKRVTDVDDFVAEEMDSHLWKSIINLWSHLNDHTWWIVSDEISVDVCNDDWIK